MQRFTRENVCGSVTYISWSSDFVLYLEDYLMDKCCTGDTDSMWHKHWTETIYVRQWPVFHGPVICLISWRNVIVGILDPFDAKINHIKCMWVSDLHFMVQWFWLLSWRWRNVGLKILIQCDIKFTYKHTCIYRSVIHILWYSDSALYFQYYLMNKPYSLDISSDVGHLKPVFHD